MRILYVQSNIVVCFVQCSLADTMFGVLEAYILELKITYLAWYCTCEPHLCSHRIMDIHSSMWDVAHLLGY